MIVGRPINNEIKLNQVCHDLLSPTRISLKFELNKSVEIGTRLHTDFEIDSLCIYLEFEEVNMLSGIFNQ